VVISVALKRGHGKCRHLKSNGRLARRTRCRERVFLPTRSRTHGKRWKFVKRGAKKIRLKKGKYVIRVRALDTAGNIEHKNRRHGRWRNTRKVRIP
jgi:hypothetical protein